MNHSGGAVVSTAPTKRQVHPLVPSNRLVQLRQLHPLRDNCTNKVVSELVRLVQFLLWQAAKPSGDNCTP